MKEAKDVDPHLEKYITKYDDWLKEGKISFSSKVIPVSESLEAGRWVLPTEQVAEILRGAKSIALKNCLCRTHYKRCDKPLEVCLVLNEAGDKFVADGQARRVSLSEAADALRKANESGLVHLTLYMPDHQVFALCSCCSCCCHDLQIVKLFNRKDLMIRSEYVAVTDQDLCIHCGDCVERCAFGARTLGDDKMEYHAEACLGCGLCVTLCPAAATSMQPRNP
ncbi:MAG TPA: 4Fe-4S binding protein [Thermodesulfobacteriota bacterium]|nr:4Fe-4S binding protein [Thermodesulfobacteriota bacterium]